MRPRSPVPSTLTSRQLPPLSRPRGRKLTPFRLAVVALFCAATALSLPPVQQALVGSYLINRTKALGGALDIERVNGSLWSGGFSLENVVLNLPAASLGVLHIKARKVHAVCNPANLRANEGSIIPAITVEDGSLDLVEAPDAAPQAQTARRARPWPRSFIPPRRLLPQRVRFIGVSTHISTSTLNLESPSVSIDAGPDDGSAVFRNVCVRLGASVVNIDALEGAATWRDSVLALRNIDLGGGHSMRDAEIDLSQLNDHQISCGLNLQAFGGVARGGLRLLTGNGTAVFEASGTLAGIDVGQFARFLGREGAFAGRIEDARYSFRGNFADIENATAALRLRANGFRWRTRQWDSLIIGATLSRRRVQVQSLQLEQPGNRIKFAGESDLPSQPFNGTLPRFEGSVEASVNNLNSLLTLLDLPGPKIGGRFSATGDIANEAGDPSGRIEIHGVDLSIDETHIAEARATLVVAGTEFSLENVAIRNRSDSIEGAGSFALSPLRTYKGDFRIAIASLDDYRPALAWWRLLPQGGRNINARWTGDGTANAHSGAFSVSVRDLKGLADLPTLSGDISGTYSPEFLYLDRFELRREDGSFETRLAVSPEGLRLDDISFASRGKERLRGAMTLPIKPGQIAAPLGPGLTINPQALFEGSLRFDDLDTAALGKFLGIAADKLGGIASGLLSVKGTASAPLWNASLTIAGGHFAGSNGRQLIDEFSGTLEAQDTPFLSFREARTTIPPLGSCVITGHLTPVLSGPPQLDAYTTSASELHLALPALRLAAQPVFQLSGAQGHILLSGTLAPLRASVRLTPTLAPGVSLRPAAAAGGNSQHLPDLAHLLPAADVFDILLAGDAPPPEGSPASPALRASLRLKGPAASLRAEGMLYAWGEIGGDPLAIRSLGAFWNPDAKTPGPPVVFGAASYPGQPDPIQFFPSDRAAVLWMDIPGITAESPRTLWPALQPEHIIDQPSGIRLVLSLDWKPL